MVEILCGAPCSGVLIKGCCFFVEFSQNNSGCDLVAQQSGSIGVLRKPFTLQKRVNQFKAMIFGHFVWFFNLWKVLSLFDLSIATVSVNFDDVKPETVNPVSFSDQKSAYLQFSARPNQRPAGTTMKPMTKRICRS